MLELETVPESDPRPFRFVVASVAVTVPVSVVPVCEMTHVMEPGPEESDAEPVHVPATLSTAGSLGAGVGLLADEHPT